MAASPGYRIGTVALLGACLLIAQVLYSAAAWAQAGVVRAVSGKAFATNAAGVRMELRVGSTFAQGTTFSTGEDEHIELVLSDGQVLILGRKSRVRIDQFQFDQKDPKGNRLSIVVEQGAMRFIGGAIAGDSPGAVRVAAGLSTIGVLSGGGVDFTVVVDTTVDQAGVLAVARGEVSLATPFGNIAKIAKDQVARWQPALSPSAAPFASLPAALMALVNAVQSPEARPGQAGTVRTVTGTVFAQPRAGERQVVAVGTAFGEGTTFFTGNNESVELVLADGQIVLLGQQSIVRIDRFQFDRQVLNQPNTSVFGVTVLNGVMRFVGGVIATNQPESVRLIAGDSNLGISRNGGIDFNVGVGVGLDGAGALTVREGELTLTTPSGTAGNISGGQGATWRTGVAPTVVPVTLMPPAVLAEILGLQTTAESEAIRIALAALPPAGARPAEANDPQIPPPAPQASTPGGGGGCVGSPC